MRSIDEPVNGARYAGTGATFSALRTTGTGRDKLRCEVWDACRRGAGIGDALGSTRNRFLGDSGLGSSSVAFRLVPILPYNERKSYRFFERGLGDHTVSSSEAKNWNPRSWNAR